MEASSSSISDLECSRSFARKDKIENAFSEYIGVLTMYFHCSATQRSTFAAGREIRRT